jgi:catechol 2,3-dioxygenase-like lactoylglutathione lyase family enzyme
MSWETAGHKPTDKVFMGISHTAISVSATEKSLQFYRDLLGMQIMGKSLNVGTEQEHLDNVFGARVRVTSVRPPLQPPHVEFLDYVVPSDGRPMPREAKAKDIVHWQTEMVVDEIDAVVQRLREQGIRFVSPAVCSFTEKRLGFKKAIMALDPDGHAMLLIEKVEP